MVYLVARCRFSFRPDLEDLGRMELKQIINIVCPKPGLFPELPDCRLDACLPFLRFSPGQPVVTSRTAHQQDTFVSFNYYRTSPVVIRAGNKCYPLKKIEFP